MRFENFSSSGAPVPVKSAGSMVVLLFSFADAMDGSPANKRPVEIWRRNFFRELDMITISDFRLGWCNLRIIVGRGGVGDMNR